MAEKHELLPFIRKKVGRFLYPYGSFPEADFEQAEGYETEYQTQEESAGEGERYRIEVLVSAEKLVPLFLDLCALLPPRLFVSLERASADAYSRWDDFMSDEIDKDDFVDFFRAYQFAFAEDGNLGIGAFSTEPSIEIFLGSHKEIVVFAPDRKPVLDILKEHGVEARPLDPYYQHEHTHLALTEYRGLRAAEYDYLHVVDVARHALGMSLQIDEDENLDDEGKPLGLVPWHAVVVAAPKRRARAHRRANRSFRQEFGLTAATRREARELLEKRLERDGCALEDLEELFRVDVEALPAHAHPPVEALKRAGIWFVGEKSDAGIDHEP